MHFFFFFLPFLFSFFFHFFFLLFPFFSFFSFSFGLFTNNACLSCIQGRYVFGVGMILPKLWLNLIVLSEARRCPGQDLRDQQHKHPPPPSSLPPPYFPAPHHHHPGAVLGGGKPHLKNENFWRIFLDKDWLPTLFCTFCAFWILMPRYFIHYYTMNPCSPPGPLWDVRGFEPKTAAADVLFSGWRKK